MTAQMIAFLGAVSLGTWSSSAQNLSALDEAKWMLARLTGVQWPGQSPELHFMAQKIAAGDKFGAAKVATSLPQFYSITIKEMAARMSTRAESVREPLNDFSAAFIGIARDNTDARELLYGNFYYAYSGSPALPSGVSVRSMNTAQTLNENLLLSNNHFTDLEKANLHLHEYLTRIEGQRLAVSATTNIAVPASDAAGVLSSRTWMAAHAIGGTNRRLVEYTFREFLCMPIEGWADTSASDTRVGKDIDRRPGGDPQKYLTSCKGCHTVMDGFRGAFARWDFNSANNAVLHSLNGVTSGAFMPMNSDVNRVVMRKMNRDTPPASTMFVAYQGGWSTTDTSFVNNASRGVNEATFGWRGLAPDGAALTTVSAIGTNAFGRLVANSRRFAQCMAQRVWDQVCQYKLPMGDGDLVFVGLGLKFEQQGYRLRELFETVAVHPRCRLR